MTRWLPICLLVFAFLLIGCTGGNTPKADPPKKSDPVAVNGGQDPKKTDGEGEPSPAKPDFSVADEMIIKEYVADSDAADKKYKEKTVEITGSVTSVLRKDTFFLAGGNKKKEGFDLISVMCGLQDGDPKKIGVVSRLSKDQKVKVIGKYAGVQPGGFIAFAILAPTELEPSKVKEVSLEELAKEFEKDPEAAATKYETLAVILSGPLLGTVKTNGQQFAKLQGTEKNGILVGLDAVDFSAVEMLKKGTVVLLRASDPGPKYTKDNFTFRTGFLIPTK